MSLEAHLDTPLAKAVRAAGSQSAFGRWIDRRQSTVFGWLKDGKPLPAEHVLEVERLSGISRHELRPDIYPQDHAQSANGTAVDALVGRPNAVACDRDAILPQGNSND
ncbi:YdaS family helix-turn-helix protein [uncultured Sphingomonas sp.]|uniref:transcriptional regulator n=1 Tax=uncultured Sphingomonas sp. TaxID=158754 RepID=UPI002600C3EF|nr:YdaS family helix-turn-helix protein [uncultured Sphingomonas sp.]